MNIGTIIDTDTLKVRLKRRMGGAALGEVEEGFASSLTPGDTFLIGGEVVRYEGLNQMVVEVTRRADKPPRIAAFMGTKFATSTQLSARILRMFESGDWSGLPTQTAQWLALQRERSKLPQADRILVESFPDGGREHVCVYGFAGRNAMQTLGLILTARMEEEGLAPMGFVSTDYAVLIWGLDRVTDPAPLFDPDAIRAGFDRWLQGNTVMKRTFRNSAIVAGLIDRMTTRGRVPGRQAAFSSDILYDTLTRWDPGHLMLRITREEAVRGLVDFGRIEEMLARTGGRIDHVMLDRVTPLAAPLFLEPGRVPVHGRATERILDEESERLLAAAGLETGPGAPAPRAPGPGVPWRPARSTPR